MDLTCSGHSMITVSLWSTLVLILVITFNLRGLRNWLLLHDAVPAVYAMALCLSVTRRCSTKMLNGLSWFLAWRLPFTHPTLCFKEIWVTVKIRVLPSRTLSKVLELENFTTTGRSSLRAFSKSVEDGRRSALFVAPVTVYAPHLGCRPCLLLNTQCSSLLGLEYHQQQLILTCHLLRPRRLSVVSHSGKSWSYGINHDLQYVYLAFDYILCSVLIHC